MTTDKLLEKVSQNVPLVEVETTVTNLDIEAAPGSVIKEGKLAFLSQPMSEGGGREFRNIVVTLVRVNKAEDPEFHWVATFEARAVGWCASGYNKGAGALLKRGDAILEHLFSERLVPFDYPDKWYGPFHRRGRLKGINFEAADQFEFSGNADSVVPC